MARAWRIVLAGLVIPLPVSGQSAADSLSAMSATLDYVFSPSNLEAYYGDSPHIWHPAGDPVSFCLRFARNFTAGSGTAAPATEVVSLVQETVSDLFGPAPTPTCTVGSAPNGARIFVDGRGEPAVQVSISTEFTSLSEVATHFGFAVGSHVNGWRCSVHRPEDRQWAVEYCRYYEGPGE